MNDRPARSEEFPRLYRTAYEFAEEVSGFRDDVPLPAHQTLALAGDVFLRYLEGHDRELSLAEAQCRLAIHQAAREGVNAAVALSKKREKSTKMLPLVRACRSLQINWLILDEREIWSIIPIWSSSGTTCMNTF